MRTHLSWLSVPALAVLTALIGGCTEYYVLDDACDDKVPGGSFLDPIESDALLRANCHRRLAGLVQGRPDPLLQEQARSAINYVLQNPDVDKVFNPSATGDYLTQEFGAPGFTGANIFERLEATGYTFINLRGTGIWELLYITIDSPELNQSVFGQPGQLTGGDAVDEFMRDDDVRQVLLQPSWVHGAWAEGDLPSAWWEAAGWNNVINGGLQQGVDVFIPPPTGRVYYIGVIYDAPHLERVDKPWTYPKRDQTQVPLYSWSVETRPELADLETGLPPTRQLSYPITIHAGSIDPTLYRASDQNPYSIEVTAASIVGPEGPRETYILHPGFPADKFWPDGVSMRNLASLYTPTPFDAATTYQLFADVSTVDGDFRVDFSFTTTPDETGLLVGQPVTTGDAVPTARKARTLPPLRPSLRQSHGGFNSIP